MSLDAVMLDKVRAFVAQHSAHSVSVIHSETQLDRDLGITGDDADELMEAFGEEFGVDVATFKHEKHFGPEAWGISALKKPLRPLRISDLVRAAELRRWPF